MTTKQTIFEVQPDNVPKHKLRQTGLEGTTPKLIKGWLKQGKGVIHGHSMPVPEQPSLETTICEKFYYFVEALG